MQLRNIHPADELAMIRSDMRRLQAREAYLRKGFLTLNLPLRGEEAVATVRILKQRRFRRDRLPADVLQKEDYWDVETIRHVCVDRVTPGVSLFAGPDDTGGQVIEPF